MADDTPHPASDNSVLQTALPGINLRFDNTQHRSISFFPRGNAHARLGTQAIDAVGEFSDGIPQAHTAHGAIHLLSGANSEHHDYIIQVENNCPVRAYSVSATGIAEADLAQTMHLYEERAAQFQNNAELQRAAEQMRRHVMEQTDAPLEKLELATGMKTLKKCGPAIS